MGDIGFVVQYWNDALTILSFVVAVGIGIYQIKHYRAEAASLEILNVTQATYRNLPGKRNTNGEDEVARGRRYQLDVRVENDGRSPTTISDAKLHILDTDEELKMGRWGEVETNYESDFEFMGQIDDELKIPENGIRKIKYRARGNLRNPSSEPVDGIVEIRSVGGEKSRESVEFTNSES